MPSLCPCQCGRTQVFRLLTFLCGALLLRLLASSACCLDAFLFQAHTLFGFVCSLLVAMGVGAGQSIRHWRLYLFVLSFTFYSSASCWVFSLLLHVVLLQCIVRFSCRPLQKSIPGLVGSWLRLLPFPTADSRSLHHRWCLWETILLSFGQLKWIYSGASPLWNPMLKPFVTALFVLYKKTAASFRHKYPQNIVANRNENLRLLPFYDVVAIFASNYFSFNAEHHKCILQFQNFSTKSLECNRRLSARYCKAHKATLYDGGNFF